MIDRLKEILKIQSESYGQWRMFAYLVRTLTKLNVKFYVRDGCIYATKGKAKVYPCIVAHMDTVHDIVEDLSVLQVGEYLTGFNTVTLTQTGIGGDDKVGIFLALEVLRTFDNVKVAFFRDEEVGCGGSYDADLKFFRDCSFVLQGDRKGNNDFVTTACNIPLSSKDFRKVMSKVWKKYGYDSCEFGGMTDVMALKEEGLPVSCANISCGYYNPHQRNEFVSIADVTNCLNMMLEMVKLHGSTPFPHKRTKPTYTKYTYYDKYNDLGFDKSSKKLDDDSEKPWWQEGESIRWNERRDVGACDNCNREKQLTFVSTWNGYLCQECEAVYK